MHFQVQVFEHDLGEETGRPLYDRLQYPDVLSGAKIPSESFKEEHANKSIENTREVLKAVEEFIESVD